MASGTPGRDGSGRVSSACGAIRAPHHEMVSGEAPQVEGIGPSHHRKLAAPRSARSPASIDFNEQVSGSGTGNDADGGRQPDHLRNGDAKGPKEMRCAILSAVGTAYRSERHFGCLGDLDVSPRTP